MKKNKIISWETLLFILYALTMGFTVFHHEPWRDEAQAWLIARDLPFFSIFSQMVYEGTPALWHMILLPFAKLGLPYVSMNLINLVIICLAAAIFVYKSPFSNITKTLFMCSYYMAWEYSIIARSYSLSVLMLFLIAALYGARFKKPMIYAGLIFLLFNTNVHSCFIAISLSAVFLFESWQNKQLNSQRITALFIMGCGAVIAFIQLLSPVDNMNYGFCSAFDFYNLFFAIGYAFFPCSPNIAAYSSFLAAIVILISVCVYIYKISFRVFFIMLCSYLGLFYLFIFKSLWGYRHFGFILIILLFTLWITGCENKKSTANQKSKLTAWSKLFEYNGIIVALNICLAISIVPAGLRHYQEYNFLFSGAKEMTNFLKSSDLTDYIIVAHESAYTSSLLPYIPNIKFWYADVEQYGTFVTWNKKYRRDIFIPFEEIVRRINKNNFPKNKTLILLNNKIPVSETSKYRLLHKVETGIFGHSNERYYLYRPIYSLKQD
ncbi:MAG: hypothetical protein V1739_04195 [Candidatus Omnitrophota bacterium]